MQPLNIEFTTSLWEKYFKEYQKWHNDQSTLNARYKFEQRYDDYIEQNSSNLNNPYGSSNDWLDEPENYWNID